MARNTFAWRDSDHLIWPYLGKAIVAKTHRSFGPCLIASQMQQRGFNDLVDRMITVEEMPEIQQIGNRPARSSIGGMGEVYRTRDMQARGRG